MKPFSLILVAAAAVVGVGSLVATRLATAPPQNVLYGDVEIRQVDLAFNTEGRVIRMIKQEGDLVHAGEVIAQLDPATYEDAEKLASAARDAAQAELDKLLHGTRPEDIEQARANLAAAMASLADAEVTFNRQRALVLSHATPQQAVDDARRALDGARAQRAQTQAALDEAVAGPRIEDIDAARGKLHEAQAALGLARTQLARTTLVSPCDGVIMTRVVEPGTVVSPTSIIYSIAISGEVWVRAFAPEPLLSRVSPGTEVVVTPDGRPRRSYRGRIGYISPQAEFTPKTVETPELRTQLVYRVRIRVENPDSGLRQGQPLTIRLPRVPAK